MTEPEPLSCRSQGRESSDLRFSEPRDLSREESSSEAGHSMSHPDIVNIVTSDISENTENDETDSFSDGGDLGCLSAGSTGLS